MPVRPADIALAHRLADAALRDAQAAQLWRLREGITESLAPYVPYKNDVSVRVSAMPAFLAETQALLEAEYPQFDVVWFGHIGDGNLHINVLKPEAMANADFVVECERVTKLLAAALERHGGSIFRRTRHRPGQEALPALDTQRCGNHSDARHQGGTRSGRHPESGQAVRSLSGARERRGRAVGFV